MRKGIVLYCNNLLIIVHKDGKFQMLPCCSFEDTNYDSMFLDKETILIFKKQDKYNEQ
jgi:hypothetical protein